MNFDLESYLKRSRALDTADIAWEEVPAHPLPHEAARCLGYMQDIESHTIIYLRTLLHTRAVDDPEVAAFLPCWVYEEAYHGRALARFLEAAGVKHVRKPLTRRGIVERARQRLARVASRATDHFIGVHMTWGAIQELTTMRGYERLSELAGHPILSKLLRRIMSDESRHFAFYYAQAEKRLAASGAARLTRFLLERAWAPVGTGVQPDDEVRFVGGYLFGGDEGLACARVIDRTVRELPGLDGLPLLERYLSREGLAASAGSGSPFIYLGKQLPTFNPEV